MRSDEFNDFRTEARKVEHYDYLHFDRSKRKKEDKYCGSIEKKFVSTLYMEKKSLRIVLSSVLRILVCYVKSKTKKRE